jgi:hypothetical protein
LDGIFEVRDEVKRQYRRFKAQSTLQKFRHLPPPGDEVIPDPITRFESCVDSLLGYALKNIEDSDVVDVIRNENNEENTQKDKPIGFSFRRKDQLSVEIILKLLKRWHNPTRNLTHWTL